MGTPCQLICLTARLSQHCKTWESSSVHVYQDSAGKLPEALLFPIVGHLCEQTMPAPSVPNTETQLQMSDPAYER